jgi:lipoyl(octanoyl) transferase
LVYETSGDPQGPVTLLICEHPPLVTIGRQGSRGDIQMTDEELSQLRLSTRWINRGGGTIVHISGQLAIYPIVSLDMHGWSAGEYLERLHDGLQRAFTELGITSQTKPDRAGLWGRTGLLAAVGVAVRTGVSYFGAYINVDARMPLVRRVHSDPIGRQPMSSLNVERRQPVRMPALREAVARHLAATLASGRYHLHSRHPLLVRQTTVVHSENTARAG